MYSFKELFQADISRYGGSIDRYLKKWLFLFRKTQTSRNPIIKKIYHVLLLKKGERHGLDIDYPVRIGPGFYLGHAYGITINDEAIIGKNCNISKGCTIGRENRGSRKGAPVLGDNVWLGVGCTVVGHIKIGNDVLIAPNSYVNCDVPDHSIVIGNPCKVISKDNATKDYISNVV